MSACHCLPERAQPGGPLADCGFGLETGSQIYAVASRIPDPLVTFNTNVAGAQVTQATGPLRLVLGGAGEDAAEQGKERLLSLTQTGSDKPGAHPESEKTP